MVRLKELGEFALIERIRRRRTAVRGSNIIVDLGDDAFAARLSPGRVLVSTKDLLIENIHFRRSWTSPFDLGYKSLAVNISDLAAMGRCRPLYVLVGIGLPGDIAVNYVDKLYTGMNAISSKYGVRIAGGDTAASKKDIVISITLIGEAKKEDLVTRRGAKAGDILFVTGTLGDSAGGLFLLAKGITKARGFEGYLLNKHRLPEPRLREAHRLTAAGCLSSMLDSSDGLAVSAGIIAEAGNKAVRIDLDKLPLSKPLRQLGKKYAAADIMHMAVAGGEEYELIFTAPASAYRRLRSACPDITPVGEITDGKGVTYVSNGKEKKINSTGFMHFG